MGRAASAQSKEASLLNPPSQPLSRSQNSGATLGIMPPGVAFDARAWRRVTQTMTAGISAAEAAEGRLRLP